MDLTQLMDDVARPSALHVTPSGERLVAMRLADDWDVGMRLHRRTSYRTWNVLEVVVRSRHPHESISGNDVRELPLGALIEEARRLATRSAAPESTPRVDLSMYLGDHDGRFGTSDLALATLAHEYVSIVETGSRTPSRDLADRFGGSPGTWTNRVAAARRRGFLTPVSRGEAGGALTPEALRVLHLPDA